MSHQCLANAFAPAQARYKAEQMKATWGHLAPRKDKTYKGYIVFAVGCFGSDELNPTSLECEFRGLDSSPWFFDALTDFLSSLDTAVGNVYRWEGTFKNFEFVGTVRQLKLV